ncbi:hypothetical protein VTK26DRAFT_186 [Humicola hyalothermophila]
MAAARHKGRPTARLAPFRDDNALVALRYEQTKQAEPPIPLPPPRDPRRVSRVASTRTSTTVSSTGTRLSPIVVNPPLVPPPQEEHPLFRSQPSSPRSQTDEAKRDSGLAPTASSSATLREECAEDPVYQKLLDDIADASPASYSNDEKPQPSPLSILVPHRATAAAAESVVAASPTSPPTAPPRPSLSKRLSRNFSIGRGRSKKRLRKKMLGADRADAREVPPETGRGLSRPQSPKTPKRPPHPAGPAEEQGPNPNPGLGIDVDASADNKSFAPINTHIPDDSLWDDLGSLSFSKRGSIMFGGKSNPFKSLITPSSSPSPGQVESDAGPPDDHRPLSASSPHQVPSAPAPTAQPTEIHDGRAARTSTTAAPKARAAMHADSPSVPSIRVSSIDVERESQKVRSLYESGDDLNWEDGGRVSYAERLEPTAEVASLEEEENAVSSHPSDTPSDPPPRGDNFTLPTRANTITPRSANSLSPRRDSQVRSIYQRAGGGIEDWDDLDGAEVDRYGFITPKRPVSRAETAAPKSHFSSRGRSVLIKRPATSYSASLPGGFIRPPSRKVSARSLNTYTSELSTVSRRSTRSSIRSATNRLPHNRDRRWMDEAGEMLSLQAGLTGITDDDKSPKMLEAQKRKEAERSEKWRKMATVVRRPDTAAAAAAAAKKPSSQSQSEPQPSQAPAQAPGHGQGLDYSFDTTSPKLIDRVWKGIPDCWRSAAWYAFLAESARRHSAKARAKAKDKTNSSPSSSSGEDGAATADAANQEDDDDDDDDAPRLIAAFHRLQSLPSPDDVQIDLDVPRTVSGHVMFRRRYRGGQRLLFRVLHAVSLYFPGVGYVQGMASLAATLLCYFDEERCFVMMVRLWRYRGMERLYGRGFDGLMGALREFEGRWLGGLGGGGGGNNGGGVVERKLKELGIDATAYGTRWYLTLFNLSIPFPAQLRVWDVFMLLGECPPEPEPKSGEGRQGDREEGGNRQAGGKERDDNDGNKDDDDDNDESSLSPPGFDVLHATSAALIHALRDVLLDSDFENAMRALTAWIPVKDEDLLMKVARAEWKRRQERRREEEKKREARRREREKRREKEERRREKEEKGSKGVDKATKEKEKEKEKEKGKKRVSGKGERETTGEDRA